VSGVIQHELAEKEAWTGLGNGFGMRKRAGQGRAGQGMGFGVSGWFYQAEYGKHYRHWLGEGPD
jgi:hypothetical protein